MKLKKLVQVMMLGCGLLALTACTPHRSGAADEASMNDMNGGANGAQASGTGAGTNWGDGSGNIGQSSSHRIYYFDFDKSVVHEQDKPSLYANANYLMSHPHAKIIIEGHTDPRGSREYNVALGERRANAVADVIRSKGVGGNQIRIVSYGAERLAAPGHSESDYQLDRRAVIVYMQK